MNELLENNQETVENLQQDTQEITQNSEVQSSKVKTESDKERNFAQLREKTARIERERDEALRAMKEMQERVSQSASVDEDLDINETDLVEGKHLRKFTKKIKQLEETLQKQQQSTRELALEAQLKVNYPDFDAVVNGDNLAQLREQYPELAHTLNANADIYSKAVSAYTLIKKLGIAQDMSHAAALAQDRDRAQRNATKPRPLASIAPQQGESPLSHANAFANVVDYKLPESLAKQLHKEMIDAIKAPR